MGRILPLSLEKEPTLPTPSFRISGLISGLRFGFLVLEVLNQKV